MEQRQLMALPETRASISTLMSRYAQNQNKSLWCEKSISTIDYIDLVYRLFPSARYICLYRNALDQLASAIEALSLDPTGASFGYTPYLGKSQSGVHDDLIDYWAAKTMAIREFESRHREQSFRLCYESMVTEPEQTIRELFAFLGLAWFQGFVGTVFSTQHVIGPGDYKIRRADSIVATSVGRGGTALASLISRDRIERVNEIHKEIGYSPI